MSLYHFFTEIDLLGAQVNSNAFGPLSPVNSMEHFNVTSMHSASAQCNAYAVTSGVVSVQADSTNTNLVNLILKPDSKPEINFIPIKYFIYKGIKKSSLFDGNGNIQINLNNELLNSIKNSWDAYIQSNNLPASLPPEQSLGIDINNTVIGFADIDPIDNLFYRTNIDFQFPSVEGGWILGEFEPLNFGLEIIIDTPGYEPRLQLARRLVNTIQVPQLTGNETSEQTFFHWHKKEEILNFIDPCAFYGSFYGNKVLAKTSYGAFDIKSTDAIYYEILKGVQHTLATDGSFANRTKTYLDIRNEHNQSFNYYDNYGDNILIAFGSNANSVQVNYYASGWPLLIIENSTFPSNTNSTKNNLKVFFPKGDNSNPLAYLTQGFLSANNFKNIKGKKRFFKFENDPAEDYFGDIKLAVPNVANLPTTNSIATYILIRYFKRLNNDLALLPQASGTFYKYNYSLDNLFFPFHIKTPFINNNSLKIKVYDTDVLVDQEKENGALYVGHICVAEDTDNYSFMVFPNELGKVFTKRSMIFSLTTESHNTHSYFINYLESRINGSSIVEDLITIGGNPLSILKFDGENTPRYNRINKIDTKYILTITIGKNTFNALLNLATLNFDMNYKVYFGVQEKTIEEDDNEKKYMRFELLLRGFENINGELHIKEVSTNQIIFHHAFI